MAREKKGAVITRGGNIYARIRFIDDSGKVRAKERKAKNRTDAKDILRTWLRDLEDGGSRRVLSENATFNDVADSYKSRKLIPAEYHVSNNRVTKIAGLRSLQAPLGYLETLKEHFGTRGVRSITHAAIQDFKLKRLKAPTIQDRQRSISSVNRELELLRAILRFAVRERLIPSSPFDDGDPLISKADENRRERVLSYTEEARLLAVCTGIHEKTYKRKGIDVTAKIDYGSRRNILRKIVIVALDTAMRKAEILTLKWSDIDFDKRQINILAFNTKTARGRSVGMTSRVFDELFDLFSKSRRQPDDPVFGVDSFKLSFTNAREDAEIDGLTFHDLRHTAITRMVQAGLPTAEIMKVSGHTQMTTFLRYLNPDVGAGARLASTLESFNLMHQPNIEPTGGGFVN